MTSAIRQFMQLYQPFKEIKLKINTRPMRKKAVQDIVKLLNNIMLMEEAYRDAIPEQFTQRHDDADQACEQLSELITSLDEVFQ